MSSTYIKKDAARTSRQRKSQNPHASTLASTLYPKSRS
uniref:Uncharacterized protein n=1 Tax=Cucumis melo TaxID=3656 RepID=A0A9I9E9D5_CUCME